MSESQVSQRLTAGVQAVTPAALQKDNFFNRNKQKLLGLVLITVSFLQQDAGLVELIGPETYAWVTRVLGLLALWFGFLNNPPKEPT